MTRQRMLELDEPREAKVPASWDQDAEAPWTHFELLPKMRCVMWDETNKQWDARAKGCEHYAHDRSVGAAMRAALDLLNAPRRERRRIEE